MYRSRKTVWVLWLVFFFAGILAGKNRYGFMGLATRYKTRRAAGKEFTGLDGEIRQRCCGFLQER